MQGLGSKVSAPAPAAQLLASDSDLLESADKAQSDEEGSVKKKKKKESSSFLVLSTFSQVKKTKMMKTNLLRHQTF